MTAVGYRRCPFFIIGIRDQLSAQPLAKKTARLIEIETFGARFRNRPLLGFAFRNNTGKL